MTNTATTPPAGMRWREYKGVRFQDGRWYHGSTGYATAAKIISLRSCVEPWTDEDHAALMALKVDPFEPIPPAPKDAPTMTTTENTTPKDAPTMTTESTTPASLIGRHALITTAHRGVFAGRVLAVDGTTVTLADARCAIYWSEAMKGVWGLAATGPDKGCRIGAAVPEVTLWSVTAMAPCTDAAVAAWQAAPWR